MEEVLFVEFNSSNRGKWIETISKNAATIPQALLGDKRVVLVFQDIKVNDIEPAHLVTLACFIELLDRRGYTVIVQDTESPIGKFLFETLQITTYWQGRKNHVPATHSSIFNLWRIIETEKEVHSNLVHAYFQRLFKDKDLSAVKISLDEVYYNIFDHADARGNAFSFIKFDDSKEKLYVAVCDFGRGIASTVREKVPTITDDGEAIEKAMENRFTIHSRGHNMGFGLGNIRGACRETDALRIISNEGFLYATSDFIGTRPNNFHFKGTLIYYELSLSHFDDLEIMANFEL